MRILYFIFLFTSVSFFSQAQLSRQDIDSLITSAKHVTDVDSSNLLTLEILKASQAIDYKNGVASSILINCDNLFNSNQFDKALKAAIEGEEFVEETGDYTKMAHLMSLKANCYGRLFFFNESNRCLPQALDYVEKIEDRNNRYFELGTIYRIKSRNIEQNYSKNSKLDSVLFYRKKSYAIQRLIADSATNESGLVIEGNAIGDLFIKRNNLDSAIFYFRKSLSLARANKFEKFSAESLLGIGLVHYLRNHLDSASAYYHDALKVAVKTKNSNNVKEAYSRLSLIYDKLGNTKKSLRYSKKYAKLADCLAHLNKNAVRVSADILLKNQSAVYANKRSNYTIIILFASISSIILFFVLLKLCKRFQNRIAEHKERESLLKSKLESLQDKRVIADTATDTIDDEALKEVVTLAITNNQLFLIRFKELHPIFIQKLMERAPNLLALDLIICAQLRLGFYTKEIARYTNSTVRAIEQRKYRIRKKLNISGTENICIWMMDL